MGKHGGAFGAAGSVGYLFKKQGLIIVHVGEKSAEDIELAAIDAGAVDVKQIGEDLKPSHTVEVYTQPGDLMKIKAHLEKAGFQAKSASLTYIPQTEVHIADEAIAQKLLNLLEKLEEDEDVTVVYHNAVLL